MSEAAVKNEPRILPYVSAINEGIREGLKEQDDCFVAGEDVDQAVSVIVRLRTAIIIHIPDGLCLHNGGEGHPQHQHTHDLREK